MGKKIQNIGSAIVAIVKWFAGALEDQKGGAMSSKRVALYVALLFMAKLVNSAAGNKIDDDHYQAFQMSLWLVGAVILFCIGAITSEFFMKNPMPLAGQKKEEDGT